MTEHMDPKFYQELGGLIRRQIRAQLAGEDTCVPTTRATVSALRLLDVDAFPLSVSVVVLNEPVYRWGMEHGRLPEYGTEEYPEGGYALGVTRHVVCVAERRWLLDYSIDQAKREQHGILLEPLAMPITENWIRGRANPLVYRYRDTFLYYTAIPGDRWFEKSNAWNGENRPTVSMEFKKSDASRVKNKRRLIR